MKKDIVIDGKKIPMQASGATPLFYREKYGHDMLKELAPIMAGQEIEDFGVFERIAHIMALRADPDNTPDELAEFLDQFDSATAIYDALGDIMALWSAVSKTTSTAKKKAVPRNVK